MRHLGLEPYPWALLKQGLKACHEWDPESNCVLDEAMEYTGAVRIEVLEMMGMMNCCIPEQETFSGDGLLQFIRDHKNHLAKVKNNL